MPGDARRPKKNHKRPAKKTVHLFAGFAFCACGGKMYVTSSNKNRYVCSKCKKNKIPIVDLEGIYHEQLRRLAISPDELKRHVADANEALIEKQRLLDVLMAERSKVHTERERVYDLCMAGGLRKEDFASRFKPLSDRLEQIDEELPALQASLDVMKISQLSEVEVRSAATSLYDRWLDLPFEDKRQVVEAITNKIVIAQEDIDILLGYAPSRDAAQPGGSTWWTFAM